MNKLNELIQASKALSDAYTDFIENPPSEQEIDWQDRYLLLKNLIISNPPSRISHSPGKKFLAAYAIFQRLNLQTKRPSCFNFHLQFFSLVYYRCYKKFYLTSKKFIRIDRPNFRFFVFFAL